MSSMLIREMGALAPHENPGQNQGSSSEYNDLELHWAESTSSRARIGRTGNKRTLTLELGANPNLSTDHPSGMDETKSYHLMALQGSISDQSNPRASPLTLIYRRWRDTYRGKWDTLFDC